jgi:predicted enzyme related to lactoylglutathione lyase
MPNNGVVHLELHTHDLAAASLFYSELLRWPTERIVNRWGSYHRLPIGERLDGGIIECAARRACWLPYVEVDDVAATAERGRALGASVLLDPREGPAGWRAVIATSVAGELALWTPRR